MSRISRPSIQAERAQLVALAERARDDLERVGAGRARRGDQECQDEDRAAHERRTYHRLTWIVESCTVSPSPSAARPTRPARASANAQSRTWVPVLPTKICSRSPCSDSTTSS